MRLAACGQLHPFAAASRPLQALQQATNTAGPSLGPSRTFLPLARGHSRLLRKHSAVVSATRGRGRGRRGTKTADNPEEESDPKAAEQQAAAAATQVAKAEAPTAVAAEEAVQASTPENSTENGQHFDTEEQIAAHASNAAVVDEDSIQAFLDGLSDEERERQYQNSAFLPSTRQSPLLTNREVWERMLLAAQMGNGSEYRAFYSSDLGGIVTHPALMTVAIDDHMIHRGHAVFDTALLTQGYVYQLGQHLDRLVDSADKAGISSPVSLPQMERIVLETAAASRLLNGSIRFWLSAGRGNFGLSPEGCEPSFYCVVFVPPTSPLDEIGDGVEGMRVKTSPIPMKHEYFATMKSTNYLQNALALMNAQDEELDQAIWVTSDGYVAEATNANLGIVTSEGDLIMPPFDHSLRGITAETVLDLAQQYLDTGELENVRSIQQRPITLEEAQAADEVFLCSSSLAVAPVVVWDGERINKGLSGVVTMSLRAMIIRHMNPQHSLGEHLEVPYGYLTGM